MSLSGWIRMGAVIGAGFGLTWAARATSYYVNSSTGSDSNSGTSSGAPWATFNNINGHTFLGGDVICLACGCTWNQEMDLNGGGTSWSSYVLVTSYGTGALPKIQRSSGADDRTIKLINPDYWWLQNLEVCDAGNGIQARWSSLNHAGLRFENLYIHDIDVIIDASPSSTDNLFYSTAIDLENNPSFTTVPASSQWMCKDIQVTNCQIAYCTSPYQSCDQYNVGSGDNPDDVPYSFQNVVIWGNWIHNCQGPANFADSTNLSIVGNFCNDDATSALPQGTTGLFQWMTSDVAYINNIWDTIPNTGSPDQVWLDCEAYVDKTYIYDNFITNAANWGIEYLQLNATSDPPRNPATDHNTNNYIVANAFVSNGYGFRTLSANGNTITGSLWDNSYYESSGLGSYSADSSFTDSGNELAASSAANIYDSAYQFSGSSQGSDQWYYQYWNGSAWNNCPTFLGTPGTWNGQVPYAWSDGNNGQVGQFALLPDTNSSDWVAYSWQAPRTGTINIRGRVLLMNSAGGSGVQALIYQNGATNHQLWPSGGSPQSMSGSYSSNGYDTIVDNVSVAEGDVIHFCVGTQSGSNSNDLVGWKPIITYR